MSFPPPHHDWFQGANGKAVSIWNPDPNDIDIEDIAGPLSKLCRFGGRCKEFYSVAQHCVFVSEIVPEEHALWGLLHDACEAYVGDVVKPLKNQLPHYTQIEELHQRAICERFGLSWPEPPEVNLADKVAVMTEKRDLLHEPPYPWIDLPDPHHREINPWSSYYAEARFLSRFFELTRR